MTVINIVTHFGDLSVVLPLSLVAMLWFLYIGVRRLIFYWAVSLATCLSITIILKMHFMSCPSVSLDLRSPSGHSSLSMFVYGGWGIIIAKALDGAKRLAATVATTLMIVVIAASRWILGAHNGMEILIGLTIGGCALIPFLYAYQHTRAPRPASKHLLVAVALVPLALWVPPPDTEGLLGAAAAYLQQIAPTCGNKPVTPADSVQ